MRQRAAAQILGHDIGPAFIFDRNEFEQIRMVQFPADLLLALEAGEEIGIGFISQVRNFHRHELVVIGQILRLVDRGHAAAADRFADQKPAVQHLAGAKFRRERRFDFVMNARAHPGSTPRHQRLISVRAHDGGHR